jgi:hypothetical protein
MLLETLTLLSDHALVAAIVVLYGRIPSMFGEKFSLSFIIFVNCKFVLLG